MSQTEHAFYEEFVFTKSLSKTMGKQLEEKNYEVLIPALPQLLLCIHNFTLCRPPATPLPSTWRTAASASATPASSSAPSTTS